MQVTKLFGVNYETTSTNAVTPTIGVALPQRSATHVSLTRSHGASTVDSGELEWCIRENSALVPSYSEALLLEGQTQPLPVTSSSYSIQANNNNNNITNSDQR